MNVLITGGAGFVGSALTDRLRKARHVVTVLDKESLGYYGEYDDIWITNILDKPMINEKHGIDVVVHCAAIISEAECQKNVSDAIDVNVKGTVNVLQNCIDRGIKKFIFLSSAAVYGDHQAAVTEFMPLTPITTYGATKLMAEYFVNDLKEKHDLNTTIFRPFNLYGPGMKHKGEYLSVVSTFIRRMIFDQEISVFGDGKYIRDYVFIDDVIDVIMIAMDPENENAKGGTFNISTGEPTKVLQLAALIGQKLKKIPKIKYLPKRHEEILYSVGDPGYAEGILNFRTKVDIEEGIQRTVDWFSSLTLIQK